MAEDAKDFDGYGNENSIQRKKKKMKNTAVPYSPTYVCPLPHLRSCRLPTKDGSLMLPLASPSPAMGRL